MRRVAAACGLVSIHRSIQLYTSNCKTGGCRGGGGGRGARRKRRRRRRRKKRRRG